MADATMTYAATGKRKTAVARVRLSPGTGRVQINQRPVEDYFPRPTSQMIIEQPFRLTNSSGQYDVAANVRGGGLAAQAAAVRHGVTRALLLANPDFRIPLKKAGFVTRDSRKVERKKYGRHKARKRPQYSKR